MKPYRVHGVTKRHNEILQRQWLQTQQIDKQQQQLQKQAGRQVKEDKQQAGIMTMWYR